MTDLTGDNSSSSTGGNTDRLYTMLDHSPDGVIVFGLDGVRYANAALAEIFGCPLQPLSDPAFKWSSLIHAEDRDNAVSWLMDHLLKRKPNSRITFRTAAQNGREQYVEVATAILPHDSPLLIGFVRDVTACCAAGAVVRNTNRLLEAVAEAAQSQMTQKVRVLLGVSKSAASAGTSPSRMMTYSPY